MLRIADLPITRSLRGGEAPRRRVARIGERRRGRESQHHHQRRRQRRQLGQHLDQHDYPFRQRHDEAQSGMRQRPAVALRPDGSRRRAPPRDPPRRPGCAAAQEDRQRAAATRHRRRPCARRAGMRPDAGRRLATARPLCGAHDQAPRARHRLSPPTDGGATAEAPADIGRTVGRLTAAGRQRTTECARRRHQRMLDLGHRQATGHLRPPGGRARPGRWSAAVVDPQVAQRRAASSPRVVSTHALVRPSLRRLTIPARSRRLRWRLIWLSWRTSTARAMSMFAAPG